MEADPAKLIAFCRASSDLTMAELSGLDRDGLLLMANALVELRNEIDETLQRLAFVEDRRLN